MRWDSARPAVVRAAALAAGVLEVPGEALVEGAPGSNPLTCPGKGPGGASPRPFPGFSLPLPESRGTPSPATQPGCGTKATAGQETPTAP